MAFFFQTRKYVYLNTAILFLLVIVWCVSSTHLVVRSLLVEPHLFYGSLSRASIPSLFGGSGIPFLDKTFFQINGDEQATFILYSSEEMNEAMSEWFSFADVTAAEKSLEIVAARVKDDVFVVQSIAAADGSLEWDELVEYQIEYLLVYAGITFVCLVGFIVFLVLGIKKKMPPRYQTSFRDGGPA